MVPTKVQLGADASAFRGPDDQMVVEVGNRIWAYRPAGTVYHRLATKFLARSAKGGIERSLVSYEDPHAGLVGRMVTGRRDDSDAKTVRLELDGVGFASVTPPNEIEMLDLPVMRSPLHLFRRPNTGGLIYLSRDRYQDVAWWESVRMFAGVAPELSQVPIDWPRADAHFYRMDLPTAEGVLSVQFQRDLQGRRPEVPTWNGEPLQALLVERYLIVETHGVKLFPNPGHEWGAPNGTMTIGIGTALWDRSGGTI